MKMKLLAIEIDVYEKTDTPLSNRKGLNKKLISIICTQIRGMKNKLIIINRIN